MTIPTPGNFTLYVILYITHVLLYKNGTLSDVHRKKNKNANSFVRSLSPLFTVKNKDLHEDL